MLPDSPLTLRGSWTLDTGLRCLQVDIVILALQAWSTPMEQVLSVSPTLQTRK